MKGKPAEAKTARAIALAIIHTDTSFDGDNVVGWHIEENEKANERWVSEADFKKRDEKETALAKIVYDQQGEISKLKVEMYNQARTEIEEATRKDIEDLQDKNSKLEADCNFLIDCSAEWAKHKGICEGRLSAIQQFRNEKIPEMKQQGDIARNRLKEFYDRLPTIKDASVVIAELQTHIGELIDHIIALHDFEDELGVLLNPPKNEGKQ